MAEASVIGSTTVVRGNVRGDGDIEILGRVEGDVLVSGDVTIGEEAQIKGRVSGGAISVAGVVIGDISGSVAVVLSASAQVHGDLITPRVGIAEGARVRGSLNTEGGGREERASARHELPRRSAPSKAQPAPAPVKAAAPQKGRGVPATPVAGKRKPPPPVVPALRKGARARKKSR
jgi:cytoskeletal protein CcmA (bactofilin family)